MCACWGLGARPSIHMSGNKPMVCAMISSGCWGHKGKGGGNLPDTPGTVRRALGPMCCLPARSPLCPPQAPPTLPALPPPALPPSSPGICGASSQPPSCFQLSSLTGPQVPEHRRLLSCRAGFWFLSSQVFPYMTMEHSHPRHVTLPGLSRFRSTPGAPQVPSPAHPLPIPRRTICPCAHAPWDLTDQQRPQPLLLTCGSHASALGPAGALGTVPANRLQEPHPPPQRAPIPYAPSARHSVRCTATPTCAPRAQPLWSPSLPLPGRASEMQV